jgi:hypothetical protein
LEVAGDFPLAGRSVEEANGEHRGSFQERVGVRHARNVAQRYRMSSHELLQSSNIQKIPVRKSGSLLYGVVRGWNYKRSDYSMKRILLAASFLTALALPANASLVLSDFVFADLGSTGFGNAPRLLNIQNNINEAGGTFYTGDPSNQTVSNKNTATGFFTGLPPGTVCTTNGSCNNQPQVEADKSLVYNVGTLGWTTGAQVGIGLDTNQSGNSGPLTFNSLVLTLWNTTKTASISFSGNAPVNISEALLAAQQGNGNSVFNIGLDAAQQAQYNAFLAANGGANNVFEGLSASFGTGLPGQVCPTGGPGGAPAGCFASNDGQESFLAFVQSQATPGVPGPIAGAGIPGLVMALGTLFGLNRYRRRRNV